MSPPDRVAAAIAELADRPPCDWPAALRARFADDPVVVRQVLLWLHAQRAHAAERGRAATLGDGERYELQVQLDTGATATVWRAYDRKLLRNVAIKVFDGRSPESPVGVGSDTAGSAGGAGGKAPRGVDTGPSPALGDILLEARAACEVISDHVVRVLDVHDAEPPYIVMELVGEHEPRTGTLAPGASAASCRPHDLGEAVRWLRDVARGVHDAHLRNVFHRDLKPHNVLITPISRRAKIADFGLSVSRAGGAGRGARSGMVVGTGAGGTATRIAGTPGYMAPEQARGLAITLDPGDPGDRAILVGVDVWGLGAVAYDLVTGHPPWRGGHGLDAWEVAASGARPEPVERTAQGDRVPRRLRRIVERALATTPGDRYPSAGELADELHAVLACRPTSFDRSPARRVALWARRNPQLTVTAVVAVVLSAMSLAAYATVRHLGAQRTALAAEVRSTAADKDRLAGQAGAARRELESTEASLAAQAASLRELRRLLAEAEDEYRSIVLAKQQALHTANVATHALMTVSGDRDIAEKTRDLYERFWERARKDAADAAHERDRATHERDLARAAADQAGKERDDARAARDRAEHDRDLARSERDRNAEARRQAEADVARLIGELSRAIGIDPARGAAPPAPAAPGGPSAPPGEPSDATSKGAAH